MEWHPEFKVGRTLLKVSFTGGHLCGGASTPAICETSDPVVQMVIETSAAYRSGRIRPGKAIGRATARADGGGPSPCKDITCGKTQESMPATRVAGAHETPMEFEDIDSASDFLQDKKGIPVDRVLTREQCVEEARRLGIDLRIRK